MNLVEGAGQYSGSLPADRASMVSNPEKQQISAFIMCLNEERNIGRAIKSVSWCDEVLIIDSGSTDRTVQIAKDLGARVIHNPWEGYVNQKRFGLASCSFPWVINIDSDEEISPELKAEIIEKINIPDNPIAGYDLLRVVFFLGKWWRKGGWYPEYRLRLLKREKASWGGDDPHERAEVSGPTERLTGELRHYTYLNFAEQIAALNNHSSTAAQSLADRGKRSSFFAIVIRPIARFFKFYLIKKGFLEGFSGFVVAFLESYYVFLKYIKLWEITRGSKV